MFWKGWSVRCEGERVFADSPQTVCRCVRVWRLVTLRLASQWYGTSAAGRVSTAHQTLKHAYIHSYTKQQQTCELYSAFHLKRRTYSKAEFESLGEYEYNKFFSFYLFRISYRTPLQRMTTNVSKTYKQFLCPKISQCIAPLLSFQNRESRKRFRCGKMFENKHTFRMWIHRVRTCTVSAQLSWAAAYQGGWPWFEYHDGGLDSIFLWTDVSGIALVPQNLISFGLLLNGKPCNSSANTRLKNLIIFNLEINYVHALDK